MSSSAFPLRFDYLPAWQAVGFYILLAIPVLWLGARSMSGLDSFRKWTSIALRLDLLMFLVLLLAGARWEQSPKELTVVVVRDVSRSTTNVHSRQPGGLQPQIVQYVHDVSRNKRVDDRIGGVSFDRHSMVDALPTADIPNAGVPAIREWADGTDVAQALRMAMATMPADTLRRIVLFWDGNATTGDLDSAVTAAAAQHIPVDVVPLFYNVDHEICLEKLIAPTSRKEGDAFTLDMVIRSHNRGRVNATLSISDCGAPMDMDPATPGLQSSLAIALDPGANVCHLAVESICAGVHRFHAAIQAADSVDTIRENNTADAVTLVHGTSRVLFFEGDNDDTTKPLRDSLLRQGFALDERSDAASFPRSLVELQAYDAVVLANVQRGGPNGLDDTQDRLLATYVRELGGGLVMVGGPHGFGAGGWAGSQVERVLPVDCQPPENIAPPPGALVIVIDHSASMGERLHGTLRTKQSAVNEAAIEALNSLQQHDRVGVIAFDTSPTWVLPLGENGNPDAAGDAIRRIAPAGNTCIGPALSAACDALDKLPANRIPVRHVLLLTDGQSDSGNYLSLIARMQMSGITLSTVGVGRDADDRLLHFLAWAGHGEFYPVTDADLLPRVLLTEAGWLRSNLIREQPFTPRVLHQSELVGDISAFPQLRGRVMTWVKSTPGIHVPIGAENGEPVLAHRRVGLGQTVAFTSDADRRWAGDWIASPMYDAFWDHVLRGVSRSASAGGVATRIVTVSPTQAKLIVEAMPLTGSSHNPPGLTAAVLGPDPAQPAKTVRLSQSGSGTFDGEFATPDAGTYLAVVRLDGATDAPNLVPAAYVAPMSAELSDLRSNETAVGQIAQATGGRVLPPFDPKTNLFDRAELRPQPVSLPLTEKLIVLAIATLLLDVASRRVLWDKHTFGKLGATVAGTVRSFTQVRVGDPEFSLGALMYVHLNLSEQRQAASEHVPAARQMLPPRCRPTPFDPPNRAEPIPTTVQPQPAGRTLDALLYAHRQRNGR